MGRVRVRVRGGGEVWLSVGPHSRGQGGSYGLGLIGGELWTRAHRWGVMD